MINKTVKDIKVTSQDSHIYFASSESMFIGEFVAITLGDMELVFQVDEVTTINAPVINGNKRLQVRATQAGYYNKNLNRRKNLDIRNLVGAEVVTITDEERIKQINRASRMM